MTPAPASIASWVSVFAGLAGACGVPIAIALYLRDRKKERYARELSTYSSLAAQYKDYLRRCMDNPELATVIVDVEDQKTRKQDLHISMVLSMLEGAFFMYRRQDTPFHIAQRSGWDDYMRLWCLNPDLQKRWNLLRQFDSEFIKHMESLRNRELSRRHNGS